MVRGVCRGGGQYYSVSELQVAAVKAWDNVSLSSHRTIVSTVPKSCIKVL